MAVNLPFDKIPRFGYTAHVVAEAADEPKWRNWQTRYVQDVVGATPWEFKSPLRHHISLGNSLMVERLTLDQVVGVRIPVPQLVKFDVIIAKYEKAQG